MNIKANLPFSSYITYLNPNTSVIRDDSYIMEIFITFIPIFENENVSTNYYTITWKNYTFGESGSLNKIKIGGTLSKRISNWMAWNSINTTSNNYY